MSPESDDTADGKRDTPGQRKTRFWLDVAMKLTVPLGAIAAALLANSFEERRSVREIVNQREQSESTLRATMFGTLIGPIVGPQKDGQPVDPVRYAVLVQLLALNFHEHFEFRPLMQHADDLLASSNDRNSRRTKETRWALRSVAHRIIDRQIAKLGEDPPVVCVPQGTGSVTFWLFGADVPEDSITAKREEYKADKFYRLQEVSETVEVRSPDCRDTLTIAFSNPDWTGEGVDVFINRSSDAAGSEAKRAASSTVGAARASGSVSREDDHFQFQVTSFAFPFTDNTPLADGNRFAVFVRDVYTEDGGKFMRVQLRWFPRGYYPVTERPADQGAVRKRLPILSGGGS